MLIETYKNPKFYSYLIIHNKNLVLVGTLHYLKSFAVHSEG